LTFNRLIEIEKEEVNQLPKGINPSILRQLGDIARRLIDENIPEDLDVNVERAIRERFRDIVGRAWWRRTWILQEIVAYDKPLFFCGEFAISKTVLSKIFINFFHKCSQLRNRCHRQTAGGEFTAMSMTLSMQR